MYNQQPNLNFECKQKGLPSWTESATLINILIMTTKVSIEGSYAMAANQIFNDNLKFKIFERKVYSGKKGKYFVQQFAPNQQYISSIYQNSTSTIPAAEIKEGTYFIEYSGIVYKLMIDKASAVIKAA